MDSTASYPFDPNQPLLVRLASQDELSQWRELIRQHHYLGFERIVGSALHYVATIGDHWVALLGWGVGRPAMNVAPETNGSAGIIIFTIVDYI